MGYYITLSYENQNIYFLDARITVKFQVRDFHLFYLLEEQLHIFDMFKNAIKVGLLAALHELGETADPNLRVVELKDLILKSAESVKDREFVSNFNATTVAERKKAEEISSLQLLQQSKTKNVPPNTVAENTVSLDKLLKAVQTLAVPVSKKNEPWNLFFDSVERAFKHKNVPNEYKSEILLKLIGEKAANILVYINEEELKDYEKIKSLILKEYEPSPYTCLESFRKATRLSGETHQ